MVSFSCEVCNDTVIEKKLNQHQQRCRGAYFTCIDCNVTFYNNDHNAHTSCITEAEKYEKGLYKGKSKKTEENKAPKVEEKKVNKPVEKKEESKKEQKKETKKEPKTSLVSSLKVKKPTSLKKLLKSLDKEQQKELLKQVIVTKNEDDSVSFQL